MAEVDAAFDGVLRREVAVKVLSPRLCGDPTMRERFLREATLAASLGAHPHVVTVHDLGEWGGRPYIVMELAAGSVADRLRDGVPPRQWALVWLAQAADALDAAHARGIVHRDVKPANLLVDDLGAVRVSDFGIARDDDQTLTGTGEVLGTAGYLAPEQARGEPCTPASDRYSLAVVAHELLNGRRDGPIPDEANAVFARALADTPGARYQTGTAFVDALTDAVRPSRERLPTALMRVRGSKRRRTRRGLRRRLTVLGACLAAIAVAAVSALATYVLAVASGSDPVARGASQRPTMCTASSLDHDANVVVRGVRAQAYCRRLAARLSSDGDVWGYRSGRRLYAPDHGEDAVGRVCRFHDRRMNVVVYDSGSQSIGESVCLSALKGGWKDASVT